MGTFNSLVGVSTCCPSCGHEQIVTLQFRFGEVWQYDYAIGDSLRWGARNVGRPEMSARVRGVVDGECEYCGFGATDDWYVHILVQQGVLTGVSLPSSGDTPYDPDQGFVRLGGDG